MTICFPRIITTNLCPRDELTFSSTAPVCVRVVPVYQDASYTTGQFPPPVHFLIADNGLVYQLAPIQSPPSLPPQYHALLDSSGCILVGVELSGITSVPITNAQIDVLPGVLRYVLVTLGLPITSIGNFLPPQRCRPQLWATIIAELEDCLTTPPPGPDVPPSLSCSFVIGCLNAGQNINISAGGTISAGQLVQGPNPNQYSWVLPNGTPLYSFTVGGTLNVLDTTTVDLTLLGGTLSADVIVSPAPGNQLVATPSGLFVPPSGGGTLNVLDTTTVDLTLLGGTLSADVIVSPAPGNQLQVTPLGLFVPPSGGGANRCIGQLPLPPITPLSATTYWMVHDSLSGCIEVPFMPDGAMPYYQSGGQMEHRNLFYRELGDYLILDFGANTLSPTTSRSFIAAAATNSAIDRSFVSSWASNLDAVSLSLAITDSSNSQNIFGSVVVGQGASFGALSNSVVAYSNSGSFAIADSLFIGNNAGVTGVNNSLITAWNKRDIGLNGFVTTALIAYRNLNLAPSVNALNIIENAVVVGRDAQSTAGNSTIRNGTAIFDEAQYNSVLESHVIATRGAGFQNLNHSNVIIDRFLLTTAIASDVTVIGQHVPLMACNRSIIKTTDTPDGRPNVQGTVGIASSLTLTSSRLIGAVASLYTEFVTNRLGIIESVLCGATSMVIPDPTPGTNSFLLRNATISSALIRIITPLTFKENFVAAGQDIVVHRDSMLVIGNRTPTSPAIEAVGGWQVSLHDQAFGSLFEVWGNSPYYFRPHNTYDTNAQAITNLNATFGSDPRIRLGTMVTVIVAGTPALFSWNGSTFVRITV